MNEKIEALEKEVKFLRELVLELSKKQQLVSYPVQPVPQPYNPYPGRYTGDPMQVFNPQVTYYRYYTNG